MMWPWISRFSVWAGMAPLVGLGCWLTDDCGTPARRIADDDGDPSCKPTPFSGGSRLAWVETLELSYLSGMIDGMVTFVIFRTAS
jgi:hypothetical protein